MHEFQAKATRISGKVQGLINGVLVFVFLALALTPWEAFFSAQMDLTHMLSGPSMTHPLGTDNLGRDLLVRMGQALRGAVAPLWLISFVATFFGGALGAVRCLQDGWLGRWLDLVASLAVSVPLGLVVFALAVWRETIGLIVVLTPLALVFALRAYTITVDLWQRDHKLGFWVAHETLGGSRLARIMRYGVASAWRTPLFETLVFHLQIAVITEASLSYLGFGVQEPQASFGNMLSSHFDLYLKGDAHVLVVILSGLALTSVVPTCCLRLSRLRSKLA